MNMVRFALPRFTCNARNSSINRTEDEDIYGGPDLHFRPEYHQFTASTGATPHANGNLLQAPELDPEIAKLLPLEVCHALTAIQQN